MVGFTKNQQYFRKVGYIIPELAASTTAGTANSSVINYSSYGANFDCTITCTTGDIWINIDAAATTSYFKLHEGDAVDFKVGSYISTISTSTAPMYQAIIWD
jgi:hypothetical protein